ncbi:MAG: hypothetical protein WBQ44_13560 [Rhodococcus sp. (in: high G+C Gram-positive bacteria)]
MRSATSSFSWSQEDWAPLTEMADGLDEYRPGLSTALNGQDVVLEAQYVDGEEPFTLPQKDDDDAVDN